MEAFLSAMWCREAFQWLGVQDVAEFDSNLCSVFCLLGEEKKYIEMAGGLFFPGPDMPCCYATWDFHGC
jgi:hypothetical protein